MHGRLKVKSTAQQEAERQAAQKKKLEIYRAASQDVMSRRDAKQHDIDTLRVIAGILEKNPDVTVLWNFRREIFCSLKESLETEEFQALVDSELSFDAMCLQVNPKSYYAWHHRCWILLNSPTPRWEEELRLCGKFLSKDERNFHCWDYRRWLVNQAKVCPEKELDFVTNKLYDNFSNFSAWHYRSRLITKVHGESESLSLPKEKLEEEYDLVRNGLFVDPSDQSPWFYHRWLLSKCTERRVILHSVIFNASTKILTVAFSYPVLLNDVNELGITLVSGNDTEVNLNSLTWKPVRTGNASSLWSTELSNVGLETTIRITRTNDSLCCSLKDSSCVVRTNVDPKTFFIAAIDSRVGSLIDIELDSIRELHSMEKDSKWVLLELAALLRIISPLDSEEEVLTLVDKLIAVDSLRQRYYNDLRSRFLIENRIMTTFQESKSNFSLPGVGLTRITQIEWLASITEIDLSQNDLQTLPDDIRYLISLVKFNVDQNKLVSLQPLRDLPSLREVSARENRLSKLIHIQAVLKCPVIKSVDLRDNPVASADGDSVLDAFIKDLPGVSVVLR